MSSLAWLNDLQLGSIRFTPVREHHRHYIYSLRVNPKYNTHLSPAPASADSQGAWISTYTEREAAGTEYYFLIERIDGTACGTVRLYDFKENSFCWGSWILDENKTRYAAIQSALLVYEIGFDKLGFEQSHFDVRLENTRVIAFHERMGAIRTHKSTDDQYMILTREAFQKEKPKLLNLLKG
ncbi:GNAT family N-acetyltransferase [Rhizobium sp. R86522]|uniref:GNAT family N-acetyltransferase n=1 Tax=Rhizobium sp. R86522 TaxID=3093861 RepID=UPI003671209D